MRPAECTHLLVPQLVRTEKFLCAMAVAPFILKEEWALESAAAKYLLRTFYPLPIISAGKSDSIVLP